MSVDRFKEELSKYSYRYHIHHPFDKLLQSGQASKEMLQMWAANRYYYQDTIPRKDAIIISRCPDSKIRANWCKHIITHDINGAISEWLMLTRALDLTDEEVQKYVHLLPATKFACDAYYNFCRDSTWQDGMCSSMTHLFAGNIHTKRISRWPILYPWLDKSAFTYFEQRTQTLPDEIDYTLQILSDYYCNDAEKLQSAINILKFKQDVLWAMMDALWHYFYSKNCRIPMSPCISSNYTPIVRILGSGAGGGVPQWNVDDLWNEKGRNGCIHTRSQCSIACTLNQTNWILINCSPDFRYQWNSLLKDHPQSKISAIVLTDNQLDHIGGLLSLRESKDVINLYCTKNVEESLQEHTKFIDILKCYTNIVIHSIPRHSFSIDGLIFEPYVLDTRKSKYCSIPTDVLAIGMYNILYAPCISDKALNNSLADVIRKYSTVLIDGTFSTMNEMPSVSGHVDMKSMCDFFDVNHLIQPFFLHINNSNHNTDVATVVDNMQFDLEYKES